MNHVEDLDAANCRIQELEEALQRMTALYEAASYQLLTQNNILDTAEMKIEALRIDAVGHATVEEKDVLEG